MIFSWLLWTFEKSRTLTLTCFFAILLLSHAKKWKLAKDQSCSHLKELDSFATASILDTAWCKRKTMRAAQCQRGIALSSVIILYPTIMSNDTSTSIYTAKYFCKTKFISVIGNIFIFIFIPSLSLSCSSVTLKYWLVFSLYLSC